MNDAKLSIASGVTVAVQGFVMARNVDIYGTVNIAEYGDVGALEDINIYGQVNNLGWLSVYDFPNSQINGIEKVNIGEDGTIWASATVTSGAEVVEICALAETKPESWYYSIQAMEPVGIGVPFTIPENVSLIAFAPMEIAGDLTILGSLEAYESVYLNGQVTNYGYIGVWYEQNGRLTIGKPDVYADAGQYQGGGISVMGAPNTPDVALYGISSNDFHNVEKYNEDSWFMSSYKKNPSFHEHFYVSVPPIAPTCLDYGQTERIYCSECGEDLVSPEPLAPLGHFYGLNEKGDSDCWNPECLTCGALRVINPDHLTASMYRMYNPNTGEHFYTGSLEERQVLEAAGWKYEGVGFTICANTGDPVFRMYNPNGGEHLYTMDEAEVNTLLAAGWKKEGIAFNSCPTKEVPQYRLFNPNATIGAYHFTASVEEKEVLLAAGWQDQGIGFYSCWQ